MDKYEVEFCRQLDVLGNQSRSCVMFTYAQLTMDICVTESEAAHRHMDEFAGFWNAVLGAFQSSAFIALGRIYDRRRDVDSAAHLVRYASEFPGIFSASSLRDRKIEAGLDAEAADEYASVAFTATAGSFDGLKAELESHTTLYSEKVEPIRHRVFAHSGRMDSRELENLFAALPVRDLEQAVTFPLRLHEALWQLFHNGLKPDLPALTQIAADVLNAARAAHDAGYIPTLEHEYAAGVTAEFMRWLHTINSP